MLQYWYYYQYCNIYNTDISSIVNIIVLVIPVSRPVASYYPNYLFEHKLIVNPFPTLTVKGGRLQRTTKHIFDRNREWIFIMFCERVFDVTKIMPKIENIELIYFPYYEPIIIHNRRQTISNDKEQSLRKQP